MFLNKSLVWQHFHQSLFQPLPMCVIVQVSGHKSMTVGFLVALLFALPPTLVILMQGISFQVLVRRILSFSRLDTFSYSKHQPQRTSSPLGNCKSLSPFKHCFPLPPFIQVDKVCGQPKQQEENLSSDNIVPVKEVTADAQTFVMAHASLNNRRR